MEQIDAHGKSSTLIHFMSSEGYLACMPGMQEFFATAYHPAYMHTNDVRAVRCPACEKTATFRETKETLESVLGRARSAK